MAKLEEENKKLRQEKKALASALAQAHLKALVLESTVEVASEHFGLDVKKNFGTPPSSAASESQTSESQTSKSEGGNL